MSSILAASDYPMEGHRHLEAKVHTSPLLQQLAPTLVSPRWGLELVWLTGPQGKTEEGEVFGTSRWRRTRLVLQTPLALRVQEVETEKGSLEEEEEEVEVVDQVVEKEEEEMCQL